MRTGFGVVACMGIALVVAGAAPFQAHAQAAPPLTSFALQKGDVPSGYKQIASTTYSLESEAKSDEVSTATLRAKGWKESYQSTFQKKAAGAVAEIDSSIDHFKGTGGVSWDLSQALRQIRSQMPKTEQFAVQGVGESAVGLQLSQKIGKVPVAVAYVVFRRGSYLAAAGVVFAPARGQLPIAVAEHYARIVDDRLRHV